MQIIKNLIYTLFLLIISISNTNSAHSEENNVISQYYITSEKFYEICSVKKMSPTALATL